MSLVINFRKFNAENDLASQRELFVDAFPETKGSSAESIEHYQWKFKSLREIPPSYEYVAEVDNKIVGYYAAIPYQYKCKDDDLKIAMVCDVMTHSSMRGKGIFTKLGAFALGEMEKEGLDLALGYPIRPEVIPGHLKVGWKVSGDLPLYLKVLKVNSLIKNRFSKLLVPAANFLISIFCSLVKPKYSNNLKIDSKDVDEFLNDQSGIEFLKNLEGENKYYLLKDSKFLEWRYSAPDIKYTVVMVKEGDGKVLAVAFVRPAVLKDIPTLAVLDIQCLEFSKEIIANLFAAIESVAKEHGSEMISFMMTVEKYNSLRIKSFAYIRSPFKFQLISRPLSKKGERLKSIDVNKFNPMWVDSDDL